MVKSVYGKLDGVDIVLRQENGKWTVPIPININGVYVVEIIAEDTCGNSAYLAKMLFVVNKIVVNSYLIPLDYQGELIDIYTVCLLVDDFQAELVGDFNAECLSNLYSAEMALI